MSTNLTWEEKWQAIKIINPSANVCMRRPGNWYVSCGMEHASGECCLVGDYGDADSPESAIDDHWRQYADGRPFFCGNKWHLWNGFMWIESKDPRDKDKTARLRSPE